MSAQELDYISRLLDSPFKPDDCQFDSDAELDAAVDAFIDYCLQSGS